MVLTSPGPVLLVFSFILIPIKALTFHMTFVIFLALFSSPSFCLRDLVRETAKKCSLVPLGVFIFAFSLFLLSEAILFTSFFWASFHSTASPFFSFQEVLFLPDPCELTYGNTLLLSNAAVSLGSAYTCRENLVLFGSPHSASFLLAWKFLSLQIKEFRNLGFYVSDSFYGSVFFFLSGLHFFHVVVGLVILGTFSSFLEAFGRVSLLFLCTSQDLYFTVQIQEILIQTRSCFPFLFGGIILSTSIRDFLDFTPLGHPSCILFLPRGPFTLA